MNIKAHYGRLWSSKTRKAANEADKANKANEANEANEADEADATNAWKMTEEEKDFLWLLQQRPRQKLQLQNYTHPCKNSNTSQTQNE